MKMLKLTHTHRVDRIVRFFFSRRVSDAELRFLQEVIERSVACMPKLDPPIDKPDFQIPRLGE
jgi:hypothetical protein